MRPAGVAGLRSLVRGAVPGRHCAHLIRLQGSSETVDTLTGEIVSSDNSSHEPLGITYVRYGVLVAKLVAAGCNVREGSEWAGHNSVAFTLTRHGGLVEDGSSQAVDRLDALLIGDQNPGPVLGLRRR